MPMLRTHPALSQIVVADRQRQAIDDAARERDLRRGRRASGTARRWLDGLRRTLRPAPVGAA